MRVFRISLSLAGLGLLLSTLSGCMTAAHAVLAPALDSAIQGQVERNATAESMGVSTAPYRGMDCASLDRAAETYRKDQYKPEHSALTSRYFGWQIDAINQVRAEKACDGDAAAQAAAPKVQTYGFCVYSPVGNGDDPDDYDSYVTPNFPYLQTDYTAVGNAQVEFNAYLKTTRGMSNPQGICLLEDSLAKLEALRNKFSAGHDAIVGNDDITIAWQPSARAVAPVAQAPVAPSAPAAVVTPAATPVVAAPLASGRGWLGVYLATPSPRLAQELGLPSAQGALIMGVVKNGAGAKAGLRSLDVVQSMDGQAIVNHEQLLQQLAAKPAGANVTFEVWRAHRLERVGALLSATATPSQIEPGAGYCYVYLPASGPDQIGWVSSVFAVPDATPSGLQARSKVVAEQFHSFLLTLGVANQVGSAAGVGICNAGHGTVENMLQSTLKLSESAAYKAARMEIVGLVWAP